MGSNFRGLLTFFLLAAVGGCSSHYVTPGPAADMRGLGATPDVKRDHGDTSINAEFEKKPLASFPAYLAVIHVQGEGYASQSDHETNNVRAGKYTVITERDAESDEEMDRLRKLPMVAGIAPVNRMLLDGPVNSDMDLRHAAARVQADIVLLYTFDTAFYVKDRIPPLTAVSLGFSPNQQARVTTTASAILMDTRSGYIYGVAEATAELQQKTNAWTSDDAVDDARRQTEARSFDKLISELERTWAGVVKQYAKPPAKAAE